MTVGTTILLVIILFFYFLFKWAFRTLFVILIAKAVKTAITDAKKSILGGLKQDDGAA